jgi:hypothetical protein
MPQFPTKLKPLGSSKFPEMCVTYAVLQSLQRQIVYKRVWRQGWPKRALRTAAAGEHKPWGNSLTSFVCQCLRSLHAAKQICQAVSSRVTRTASLGFMQSPL